MNNSLLDALKSEVPLIMDGAMGTELERRETHISSEDWVSLTLRTMKDTEAVHSEYALAGAKLHIANTFVLLLATIWTHLGLASSLRPKIVMLYQFVVGQVV